MRCGAFPRHRSHKRNLSFGAVLGRCAAQNRTKRRLKCPALCAVEQAYRITKANVPIVKFGMTHDILNISRVLWRRPKGARPSQHAGKEKILGRRSLPK